ncbi:MAG TPA: DNA polymerase III subunit chi, partial [Parvularculaceae bacterium]|nr:DNA polymerase III subunit chi [Parvularculaceae bacterium]
ERVEALDGHLWTYRDDSFLPHAAGGTHSELQPVWLTDTEEVPNGADVLFLVDGAEADPEALSGFSRCVMIFDGADEGAVTKARGFWKAAADAGHDATYWKQSEAGRWEKQS